MRDKIFNNRRDKKKFQTIVRKNKQTERDKIQKWRPPHLFHRRHCYDGISCGGFFLFLLCHVI
jgi:hypothetical protein